jgi:hypothetical protein
VFAAAQEVMSEIYEVATAARVIPVGKLPQPGSPQEEQLLGKALMYATDQFARRLETSGQIPQKEAAEHLNSEMRREAETGELDDFDPMVLRMRSSACNRTWRQRIRLLTWRRRDIRA